MPMTVTMPALSPTMKEGVIAKWLKQEGDKVEVGEVLCEITTDKSTVEYESIESGFLRRIVVPNGGRAVINQGIAVFTQTANEDISNYKLEEPNLAKEEVVITSEDPLEAPKETKKQGASIQGIAFEPVPPRANYQFDQRDAGACPASPLAKKLAKEKNLSLASVKGSGPGGRIVAKDLEFAQGASSLLAPDEIPRLAPGTYEEEALTPMRKVIGDRLQASKMMIPHYYVRHEINVDRMIDLRAQLKEVGMKVTYNDFVLKAIALSLRNHPEINSGYNSVNQSIIRFKTVDIALAVSIPQGLITPIICHADYKSIEELSEEARRLAKRAKEGTLKPEEYQGGSFTLSNLGMYGITSFDAVINPPQAAILAVGGIHEKVVMKGGVAVQTQVMAVTLSLDHRVIDGAEAANFLLTLKKLLENPAGLLL